MLYLRANADELYHLDIGKAVAKSTLSVTNKNRPFEIYRDLAMLSTKEAKRLYIGDSDLNDPYKTTYLPVMPLPLIYAYQSLLLGNIQKYKR